jgi:hypothetical protein
VGKHPRSAPGARRRVAVRDELVAAGVGGGLLRLIGGQSCWLPVLRTANPAAWMQRWSFAPRFAPRSASPRWNRTWRSVASWWWRAVGVHRWRFEPGRAALFRVGVLLRGVAWLVLRLCTAEPAVRDRRSAG